MPARVQLNLPPTEVHPVSRTVNRPSLPPVTRPVNGLNPLRWVREALSRARLSQGYLAAAMGISEPLISAQLSEHAPGKHLSMRRLGRVQDTGFWREFALLILEDLGLAVVVMDRDQYQAYQHLATAALHYTHVTER